VDKPSLADAQAKLCRARKHLADLKGQIEAFRQTRPYRMALEGDIDNGEYAVIFRPLPLPKEIALTIGDCIANLRSALDHLVYAVAWLDSGTPQDDTQFPITDSPEKFESAKRRGRLAGMSDEHVAYIELLQPYNGGGWLATLRDLSNPDKHMHVVVAGPQTLADIQVADSTQDSAEQSQRLFGGAFPGALFVHVDFDVALYEAFADRTRVIPALEMFESQISKLVEEFEPAFKGKGNAQNHSTPL
jgi:hypothetical protein